MDDEFRKEVARISCGDTKPAREILEVADPPSRGWLRRSEFDVPGMIAWEQPDGTIVGTPEAPDPTSRA